MKDVKIIELDNDQIALILAVLGLYSQKLDLTEMENLKMYYDVLKIMSILLEDSLNDERYC